MLLRFRVLYLWCNLLTGA